MTTLPVRPPITCTRYDAVPGTKRCRHYKANGACSLPHEFMCVEWLKVNGPVGRPVGPVTPPTPPPLTRTLFGDALATAPPRRSSAPSSKPPVADPGPVGEPPSTRLVTDADITSFKALGVEVRLASDDLGELWIVPEYTGAERHELSVEHAALIAAVTSAFPGARVTALVKKPTTA